MDIFSLIINNLSNFLLALISLLFAAFYFQARKKINTRDLNVIKSLEERSRALTTTKELNAIIFQTLDFDALTKEIANAIPKLLGYKTGVLAIVDESKGVLRRVAISETSGGVAALKSLEIPFGSIEISLTDQDNYCIRALKERRILSTSKLYDVLRPAISVENSEVVQKMMGTLTTIVYPIYSIDKRPLGTFIVSMEKTEDQLTEYERQAISNFVEGVRIALVNAQLYTFLKSTTSQLQIANQKLKELDKLKDDFVSIASHELRTPMSAIKSYLWMALNRPDIALTERMKKYLSRSYISTERLINLVNDMLNVSRIESGRIEIKPEAFSISHLVEDVMLEIKPKADEKQLNLNVAAGQLPPVFADPDKVHQILLNLLGNSMKFTPDQGTITVSFFNDGKMLETSVKDSGVGISRDDLFRLFQKFGRLDNSYVAAATTGGTGLGLFISKSLVELMGGKIRVSSEGLGKGTTFTFSLPIETPEVVANAAKYTKTPIGEAKELEPVAI